MSSPANAEPQGPGSLSVADAQASLDFIFETLSGAEIHAQIGQRYARLGCVAGLSFAVRCLVANARATLGALADLRALQEQQEAASRPERIWTEEDA